MCFKTKNFDPQGIVGHTPNIRSLFFLKKSVWMFTKEEEMPQYIISLQLQDLAQN
jgi:hypothetical protein